MPHFFAVEGNNRAWELTEQASRSEEEAHEMRTTAHAAAYHWAVVAPPVNRMRAHMLLAEVAAQDDNGALALSLARSCCKFFEKEDGTEWDRPFATLELAFAHAGSGQHEKVSSLLEKALRPRRATLREERTRILCREPPPNFGIDRESLRRRFWSPARRPVA
jgi:hypothetical protein